MPTRAIRNFLRLESSGGILLMIAAGLALLVANTPGFDSLYRHLLDAPVEVRIGALHLKKTVLLVINDGLMAVFFLLVGLEIKREALEGEFASLRQMVLPGAAAAGGVVLPAVIFSLINGGDPVAMKGWAIPAATDIAFSLGILSLLGPRVPISLKVLLTAVAVIDDLAAIVIIAVFYTANLSMLALVLGLAALVILFVMNRAGVSAYAPYFIVGAILWVCVLKSGVHATLAGVALGFAIPLRSERKDHPSPLRHLEHVLHPWVAFAILPLFAFANSGVSFDGMPREALTGPVTLGIACGLFFGKVIGVFTLSWLVIRSGLAALPKGADWRSLFGVAMLTGIGFTMSLFIGMLAYEGEGEMLAAATRIGVFGGSIAAAVAGYFILKGALPPGDAREGQEPEYAESPAG